MHIELSCGEETMTICSVVSTEYQNVTDGWTDRIAISISCVSVLTRDKNHICQLLTVAQIMEARFN